MALLAAVPASLGLPWAASGSGAEAQESATPGGVVLEQITVTAPSGQSSGLLGSPDWIYETPASVSVVSREALDRMPPRNTSDMVQDVPGVWTQTARQDPGISANIRGLQDFGRVNVTLDGARQNFQQSGHGANGAAYIDGDLVREVEVDKGPTSTAGGAGVIGGVMAFRTLEAGDLIREGATQGLRYNATTGTNGYRFTGSAAGAVRFGDSVDLVAALSRRSLGEYEPGSSRDLYYDAFTGSSGAPLRFTGQDTWSGLLKSTFRPGEGQELKLGWVGSDNTFNTGENGLVNENRVRTGTVTGSYSVDPETPLVDAKIDVWRTMTRNDQFRAARTDYGAFDVSYATDTTGGDMTNMARFKAGFADVTLTQGFEYFHDHGRTDAIALGGDPTYWLGGPTPGGDRDVASGFAEAKLSFGRSVDVIGGLRYDRFQLSGDTATPDGSGGFRPQHAELSGGALLPKITLAVTPVEGVQLYGTRAEGFRPPATSEALMFGEHLGGGILFLPNPTLRPERSLTYEAGVNLKTDDLLVAGTTFRAKAAVFDTRVEGFIGQFAALGGTAVTYGNVEEARFRGVELEANYDIGRAFFAGAYTHIQSRFTSVLVPPGFGGLAFTPPEHKLSLSGGMRFFDRAMTVGAKLQYSAAKDPPLGFGDAWASFKRVDVFASYSPSATATLRASVENLFDEAYVDPVGNPLYPAPGRTATLGMTLIF